MHQHHHHHIVKWTEKNWIVQLLSLIIMTTSTQLLLMMMMLLLDDRIVYTYCLLFYLTIHCSLWVMNHIDARLGCLLLLFHVFLCVYLLPSNRFTLYFHEWARVKIKFYENTLTQYMQLWMILVLVFFILNFLWIEHYNDMIALLFMH